LMAILLAALLLGGVGTGYAAVRIANDPGGRIGVYVDKYQHLRDSGEIVIIDGLCAGACTIVLGAIPRDKVCFTSNAKFGFQVVWDFDAHGQTMPNPEATQMLYSMYPSQVKHWIAQRGLDRPHDRPSGQAAPGAISILLCRRPCLRQPVPDTEPRADASVGSARDPTEAGSTARSSTPKCRLLGRYVAINVNDEK
jgi:hypothetical protein